MFTKLFRLAVLVCLVSTGITAFAKPAHSHSGVSLSDFRGKWVIVNYWANWCPPCHAEVPALNAFNEAHKNGDAVVLGVNYDQLRSAELRDAVQSMAITFPMLTADPSNKLGIGAITGLPTSFIVSPEGRVVKTLSGEQTESTLEAALEEAKREVG